MQNIGLDFPVSCNDDEGVACVRSHTRTGEHGDLGKYLGNRVEIGVEEPADAEVFDPVISAESPYTIEETVENLKMAIADQNFTLIRTDYVEHGLVEEGKEVQTAGAGCAIEVVTDTTPFYGEAGGQAGDIGKISGPSFEMRVENTIKDPTGLIIHQGKVVAGSVAKGDRVTLSVDVQAREATARNHTATHILHAALQFLCLLHHLREVLHRGPISSRYVVVLI